MDIPIRRPVPIGVRNSCGLQTLLGGEKGFSEGTNVLYDNAFVYIDTNGKLASSITVGAGVVASGAGTLFAGFIYKSRSGETALRPPYVMSGQAESGTFQPNYWPHDIRGMRFAMNITTSAFAIGEENTAPTLAHANCIIGKELGIVVGGTSTPTPAGNYAGVYAIDIADTTNPDVRIVDIPAWWNNVNQSTRASAYNGIVIVEIVDDKVQNHNG
jgi:hypothetical protein